MAANKTSVPISSAVCCPVYYLGVQCTYLKRDKDLAFFPHKPVVHYLSSEPVFSVVDDRHRRLTPGHRSSRRHRIRRHETALEEVSYHQIRIFLLSCHLRFNNKLLFSLHAIGGHFNYS